MLWKDYSRSWELKQDTFGAGGWGWGYDSTVESRQTML